MTTYQELAEELIVTEQVTAGKWFSLPCLKANGYIFVAQWINGDVVFKLRGKAREEALALAGAKMFDPGENGAAMREWIQISPDHAAKWRDLAFDALEYVRDLPPKPAPKPRGKKPKRP
jgi:hypothetical protein